MILTLQQWHERYQQQAKWTHNLRNYVFNRVGIHSADRILEVGCGTGVILQELTQVSQGSIFGLDIDYKSTQFSRDSVPAARIVVGDGLNLPYQPGSFDFSLCHFLLLWVSDPLRVVKEMSRITRPGGFILALAEPDYGGRIDYPNPLSQIGAWQAEALHEQGANPNIGRVLRALFSNADLINIEVGVLGGHWRETDQGGDFDLEWEIIESDLQTNNEFILAYEELRTLDRASRDTHQRILYVPTFYAMGEVKT